MQPGFSRLLIAILIIGAILYFVVEPGTGRETAEELRQSVRAGVHDAKERLDAGFSAAKKDVETIKSDIKNGDRNDREPEPRRP